MCVSSEGLGIPTNSCAKGELWTGLAQPVVCQLELQRFQYTSRCRQSAEERYIPMTRHLQQKLDAPRRRLVQVDDFERWCHARLFWRIQKHTPVWCRLASLLNAFPLSERHECHGTKHPANSTGIEASPVVLMHPALLCAADDNEASRHGGPVMRLCICQTLATCTTKNATVFAAMQYSPPCSQ